MLGVRCTNKQCGRSCGGDWTSIHTCRMSGNNMGMVGAARFRSSKWGQMSEIQSAMHLVGLPILGSPLGFFNYSHSMGAACDVAMFIRNILTAWTGHVYTTVPFRPIVHITHHKASWTEPIWLLSCITRTCEHPQNWDCRYKKKFRCFVPTLWTISSKNLFSHASPLVVNTSVSELCASCITRCERSVEMVQYVDIRMLSPLSCQHQAHWCWTHVVNPPWMGGSAECCVGGSIVQNHRQVAVDMACVGHPYMRGIQCGGFIEPYLTELDSKLIGVWTY